MQQRRRCSGLIIGLVALGVLAGVALTAGLAQAVDALGPYYAEPAWDRKIPTATRFVVLTNWNSEAVLDKETGLVWERLPDRTFQTWFEARRFCTSRTTGTRKGWRLPSIHELASLIDPSENGLSLPMGIPFDTVEIGDYWSATTNAGDPALAWNLFSGNGEVFDNPKASVIAHAWCVRGGNNAEAY